MLHELELELLNLNQVIIGGAEEELSLEKLMAEVEEEVRKEREQNGGALDEEELSRRIHTRFNSRGTRIALLQCWCYKKSSRQFLVSVFPI